MNDVFEGTPRSAALSPDGSLMATGDLRRGRASVAHARREPRPARFRSATSRWQGVAFVDDKHLAVTPATGNLLFMTIDTDELLKLVRAFANPWVHRARVRDLRNRSMSDPRSSSGRAAESRCADLARRTLLACLCFACSTPIPVLVVGGRARAARLSREPRRISPNPRSPRGSRATRATSSPSRGSPPPQRGRHSGSATARTCSRSRIACPSGSS